MPFDSFGNYVGDFKSWDRFGNNLPAVDHFEGFRPGDYQVAEWLPTAMFEKYHMDWYVIMPGKIVACDNQGRIVPAQYGLTGATITYQDRDAVDFQGDISGVGAGVIDVRTGQPLLLANVGTFSVASVTDFMGTGEAMVVGDPIGVAPYAMYQAAGGDGSNPAQYRKHNYNRQASVAILCDYVLELPLVPAAQSAEALTFNAESGGVSAANAVANLPVAKNTIRTPMVFTGGSSATLFVNEQTSLSDVTSAGDWFIDLSTGVVSVWVGVGGGTPAGVSLAYYHYAAAPSSVSAFASVTGDPKCGDVLVCDSNSNFVVKAALTSTDVDSDAKIATEINALRGLMGQVISVASYPQGGLERVKTPNHPLNNSAQGALPGYIGSAASRRVWNHGQTSRGY